MPEKKEKPALPKFVQISVGGKQHEGVICGLAEDGTVWRWTYIPRQIPGETYKRNEYGWQRMNNTLEDDTDDIR